MIIYIGLCPNILLIFTFIKVDFIRVYFCFIIIYLFFRYCHLLLICKRSWILMSQIFAPLMMRGQYLWSTNKNKLWPTFNLFFVVGFNYWGGCNSICSCPFCIRAMALFIQNKSSNNVSVFSILCFLKCEFRIISICLFLFVIVLAVRVILLYLRLFLVCHISYRIICIIVNVSFLVSLFTFLTFRVSRCCVGV